LVFCLVNYNCMYNIIIIIIIFSSVIIANQLSVDN